MIINKNPTGQVESSSDMEYRLTVKVKAMSLKFMFPKGFSKVHGVFMNLLCHKILVKFKVMLYEIIIFAVLIFQIFTVLISKLFQLIYVTNRN